MARGYPDYRYFSFPVSVSEGGTGVGTLTLNGVLLGNATSQILATAAGAADQVLRVPAIGGAPAFGAVDLSKAAAVTGALAIANGGTGQTAKAAAFNALSPMTTAGDLIYGAVAGAGTRLTPGTTVQLLHSGSPPTWAAVSLAADVSGDLPLANLTTGAADQVLRVPGAGGDAAWGALDLSKAAAVTGLLAVANGGTGTATPALVAGANIGITGTWPAQTVAFSGILPLANGGTGTATPSLVAGANIGISGSWPNQTVAVSATPSFTSLTLTNPLPVAYGGTGTATGSITGTGALTFASGGADQNITLSPSGTGYILLGGNVGIGIAVPSRALDIQVNAASGTYGVGILGAAGVARSLLVVGQAGFSNGFTIDYTGTAMQYVFNNGNVGIGVGTPGKALDVAGDVRASLQLISTVAIGTAPLVVTSTTLVTNLNAERVAGTQVTNAATLGLLLIGSGAATAAWATPDGARVYHSTTQTINTASALKVAFDLERFDNGGLHDTVTNNSRLTAQKAGKYHIWAGISMTADAAGFRELVLLLNNTTTIAAVRAAGSASFTSGQVISTIYHLAATDYVEVRAYQASGSALTIQQVPNDSPEFAMQWLGP